MKRPALTIARAAATCLLAAGMTLALGCERAPRDNQENTPSAVTTPGGVRMILLPGGSFTMGSAGADEEDETPHQVHVSPFAVDQYEVTQAEYEKVTGSNPSGVKHPDHPADHIRWYDAVKYCNARSRREGLAPAYDPKTWECDFSADGYRLPTEAEWEYAARAGSETLRFFGDDASKLADYAWFAESCDRNPQPVGGKRPNAWGLHDMYGNVWEWCHDRYGARYYQTSPPKDPTGPAKGSQRVLRGGGWNSRPTSCRSACREYGDPAYTDACFRPAESGYFGFRCVRRIRPSQ